MKYTSDSIKETHKISEKVLKGISCNLICLYGDLGAGKTTFVQGLAKALGVKKRVISPTFVLIREYRIKLLYPSPIIHYSLLTHIDLYRVESDKDVQSLDLSELWSDPKNLVVIEWAEKIKSILPKKRIDVKFSYVSQDKRRIEIIHRHG